MRVLVIYESVYGNTHRIADAVATGLRDRDGVEVELVTPEDAEDAGRFEGVDLLVVGGPTHMHGMAWSTTKHQGAHAEQEAAAKGKPAHELDDDAFGETLRHWFHHLPQGGDTPSAAFDTRFDAAPAMTGRASKGIARRLHHHGWAAVVEPESFLVTKDNELVDGEEDRARTWGEQLADAVVGRAPTTT
ncbi:MAG: flavodoxin domain-containing protein [Acidimicrobiales bacterium]